MEKKIRALPDNSISRVVRKQISERNKKPFLGKYIIDCLGIRRGDYCCHK